MTEREQRLIEEYIPNPRDETLGAFEYYVEDLSGRVQKVEIVEIMPRMDRETIYRVVQTKTRKYVKGFFEYDGFTMSYLYDNKKDCKDGTHNCFQNWEKLRDLQKEAAL